MLKNINFSNLDFRTIRSLQICLVFTASITLETMLHIPRAAWVGFTVMMIYVGFDAGSTLHRTLHRFWGVILGLFLAYILWFIGHVDYRLLFLIIPILVFFAYFVLGRFYTYPTIFTVTLTVLGPDYFGSHGYYVTWFFSDYLICTILALCICVFFEYYVFRGYDMTRRFYVDLHKEIIKQLMGLLAIVKQDKVNKSNFIRKTVDFNKKVIELNTFTQMTVHNYHASGNLILEMKQFSQEMNQAYQNLRRLFLLGATGNETMIQNTYELIEQLRLTAVEEKVNKKHV